MCHGKLVRLTLHIINFLIWVCSVLLIVFGAIGVASPSTTMQMLAIGLPGITFIPLIINISPFLEGTSIFMIVLGSILFLYTFFACFAVHKAHGLMMKMYWLTLICGFLAEMALIIFSGVYPGTTEASIQQQMYANLTTNFTSVSINSGIITTQANNTGAGAWEQLQFQAKCCGAYSYADFSTITLTAWQGSGFTGSVPPSCCAWPSTVTTLNGAKTSSYNNYGLCTTTTVNNVYVNTQPCSDVVMATLYNFNYIAVGIAASLLIVQMVSTILAILLRSCDKTEYV
jgi:hypothetical protein